MSGIQSFVVCSNINEDFTKQVREQLFGASIISFLRLPDEASEIMVQLQISKYFAIYKQIKECFTTIK
jgi:hypothetical protein